MMMKVMTLNMAAHAGHSLDALQEGLRSCAPGGIDVLCCQSMHQPQDGGHGALNQQISEATGLLCGCFATGQRPSGAAKNKQGAGLAAFTGPGVWMLNSGSFAMGKSGKGTLVQFCLVRKQNRSVLALNLSLATSMEEQTTHLEQLFCHSLLKERYDAVLLCTDHPVEKSGAQWKALASLSRYTVQQALITPGGAGTLCLLTTNNTKISVGTDLSRPLCRSRNKPRERRSSPCNRLLGREDGFSLQGDFRGGPLSFFERKKTAPLPGMLIEFELERTCPEPCARLTLPLSFREQWLGFKVYRLLT